MKKILFAVLILAGLAAYVFVRFPQLLSEKKVYIAVVGPLKLAQGEAMRKGVELYREIVNQQGGIDGRRLELLFYDDENIPEKAEQIALDIIRDNKALLVLGHYYDDTSVAAGKIYKKNEIPAITASASAEEVIEDNQWYFRAVPGNAMEGQFIAYYIFDIISIDENILLKDIKKASASIIFSKDAYGLSLLENFEKTFGSLNGELKGKWAWDFEKDPEAQLETIKNDLAAMDDPGIIFFATHSDEGAAIVAALKDSGRSYNMIASYAFSRSFLAKLKKDYPKEEIFPGYYSDGIYFISPFMLSLNGTVAFEFRKDFFEKYHEKPDVVSACYYDAAHLAVEAMKKIRLSGSEHIREERRNVRDALAGFYHKDRSVDGVTGQLWFNEHGGVSRQYNVGMWEKSKETAAFDQYGQHVEHIGNLMKGVLEGKIIIADKLMMGLRKVVHVSMDQIRVTAIDKKHSAFSAYFSLRFQYPAHFDIGENMTAPLEFTNAVIPVVQDPTIKEEIKDGIISKTYKFQGKFKADFDLRYFPFNSEQRLFIRMRHAGKIYYDLVYIPETAFVSATNISVPSDWVSQGSRFYQDVLTAHSVVDNLLYSRFNTEISVSKNFSFFTFFTFFSPLLIILVIVFWTVFVSTSTIERKLLFIVIGLSLVVLCYPTQFLFISSGTFTVVDYGYFAVLIAVALSIKYALCSNKLKTSIRNV